LSISGVHRLRHFLWFDLAIVTLASLFAGCVDAIVVVSALILKTGWDAFGR